MAGGSGYECRFVSDPPDQFICLICTCVAKDPYQVVCCGKVYCKGCLDELKRRSNPCPNCRQYSNSFLDRRADRDIQALLVKCDSEDNGCEWNGELRQLDTHMGGCGFLKICCPNKCLDDELKEVFVMRKDLDSHLRECPSREFECPHCKEVGEYHEMMGDHLDDCPQIEVPCPKRCKTEVFRGELQNHLRQTCPNVAVCCKYTELGCKERPLRKDREEHEGDSTLHLQLALDTIVAMKENSTPTVHVFKMPNVESYKRSHEWWFSPPFYSHPGGYHMQLNVYFNVDEDDKVAVFHYLLRGRNDDNLIWPFRGEVNITLLNQLADTGHHSRQFKYSEHERKKHNTIESPNESSSCGWGWKNFISYSRLQTGYATKYLKDDSLYFRISVKVDNLNKPWLNCTTPF